MKKTVLFILVAAMAFVMLFGGCAKKSDDDVQEQPTTETATEIQATEEAAEAQVEEEAVFELPIAEGETLTILSRDNYYTPKSYSSELLPVFEELEKRTGVKIEFQVYPTQQYPEVANTRLAAGVDIPDIIMIQSQIDQVKLYEDGIIADLTDLIDQYAPDIKRFFEMVPDVKKTATSDGKILYLPNAYYVVSDMEEMKTGELTGQAAPLNAMVPVMRKDWLDALGLEVPTTLDEWYTVLKAFKEEDPNGNGLADEIPLGGLQDREFFLCGSANLELYWPSDGFSVNDEGKVEYDYINPELKTLIEFNNKLYSEGLLDPESFTDNLDKVKTKFATNTLGAANSFWNLQCSATSDTLAKSGVENAELIPVVPPVGSEGKAFLVQNFTNNQIGMAIADGDKKEIAIKWMNYFYASYEGLLLTNYGIEGETYTMVDGKPEFTDFVLNNESLSATAALQSVGAKPSISNTQPTNYLAALDINNPDISFVVDNMDYAIIVPAFASANADEAKEYSRLMGEIDTYREEMLIKMIMGVETIDKFDEYLETMNQMGIDQVIAIKQAQYDRYNAD